MMRLFIAVFAERSTFFKSYNTEMIICQIICEPVQWAALSKPSLSLAIQIEYVAT